MFGDVIKVHHQKEINFESITFSAKYKATGLIHLLKTQASLFQ